jgi:uncharacterized repeat protein (TIGR01451 family)
VSLTDTNFGNFLYMWGDTSAVHGHPGNATWQMDTSSAFVHNLTWLNIWHGSAYVDTILSLQYFPNLRRIDIADGAGLSYISYIPPGVTHLSITHAFLTQLPPLADSLTHLGLINCTLHSLPDPLPDSLVQLNVDNNYLDSLPSLPAGLTILDCGYNSLTQIPALPHALTSLQANRNRLVSLPALPQGMTSLSVSDNQLTYLPSLPNGIKSLACHFNQLTALPAMPDSLLTLILNSNHQLACVPPLPFGVSTFWFDSTMITCMPNRIGCTSFTPADPNSLPLCSPVTGCAFDYNIAGNVHLDSSTNCLADSLYNGTLINGVRVLLTDGSNVLKQSYTYDGQYSFKTNAMGSYHVLIDTVGLPFGVVCPSVHDRPVNISAGDTLHVNQDFGMQCNGGVDNGVVSISGRVRLHIPHVLHIKAGNISLARFGVSCGTHSSGTVQTIVSGCASYSAPAPGALTPDSVSGDTLLYNIADLSAIHDGDFDISVVGTNTCGGIYAWVTSMVNTISTADINHANDTVIQQILVLRSSDPNAKSVSPVSDLNAVGGQWLTYTVDFQNTGNDTAYLVVVRDTLDSQLDPLSFQMLAASHRSIADLSGNAMSFTFPKINLVDSLHNEPLSHGWLQYRVKTKPGLTMGSQIANTASIYFDQNSAVVTNTVISQVQTCRNTYDTLSIAICRRFPYTFGGVVYGQAGYYNDTLPNAHGCDSIVTLHISVLSDSYDTISRSICSGDSFAIGIHIHRSTGTYTDTLEANNYCDSIVTLHLMVDTLPGISVTTTSHSLCLRQGAILTATGSPSGGSYQWSPLAYIAPLSGAAATVSVTPDSNTVYYVSYRSPAGCVATDSVPIVVHVPVSPVITRVGDTLYANAIGHWTWAFNRTPIYGDTLWTHLITANGLYWLTETDTNGCIVLSTNIYVTNVGVNDLADMGYVVLYPNPNSGTFTLETTAQQGTSYVIYDMLGQIVQERAITTDHQTIDMSTAAEGIYTLMIKGRNGSLRFTVMR